MEESHHHSAQHHCGKVMDRPGATPFEGSNSTFFHMSSHPFLFFFFVSHQSGEIDVVNHTTGDRCHLKFAPYSYFSRDVARKVRIFS